MAQRRLTFPKGGFVQKIKEALRLRWGLGLSGRQVSASLKIAHNTVGEYLTRAEQAGLD